MSTVPAYVKTKRTSATERRVRNVFHCQRRDKSDNGFAFVGAQDACTIHPRAWN